MKWMTQDSDFREVLSNARKCISIDNGENSEGRVRFLFDSVELGTDGFFVLVQTLMNWSGDLPAYHLVLDPDPLEYFHKNFSRYPLLEISVGDSPKMFATALAEDPGGSPADAVGINWFEYVLFPRSRIWFVRAVRDDVTDEGGHLWVPKEWAERVIAAYPWATQG